MGATPSKQKVSYFTNPVPKKIWTYWNEDPVPDFIQRCIETWRKENPDHTVYVVNDKNLSEHLGEDEAKQLIEWKFNDSPQRMSDLVRLAVIAKHGGVWLDASIICYENLGWVETALEGRSCAVYSIPELAPKDKPLLESWFIAATKDSEFVRRWRDEFIETVPKYSTIQEYVDEKKAEGVPLDAIETNTNYLLVYICARKALRECPENSVKILNASEGPYSYHTKGGVSTLCTQRPPKIMKLRKDDRKDLLESPEAIQMCAFDKTIPEAVPQAA